MKKIIGFSFFMICVFLAGKIMINYNVPFLAAVGILLLLVIGAYANAIGSIWDIIFKK
jgi:hypothetical protein